MKKFQSIGVVLSAITLLLVVLLVSVFTYSAGQAYARREAAVRVLKTVDVLRDVYVAEDALRDLQGAMNTALAVATPRPNVNEMIARLHVEANNALSATHANSETELGGHPNPNGPHIREALSAYEKTYQEAFRALWLPREQRPQALREAWIQSVNQAALAINMRTRERSMYIADSIVLNDRISTRELQDFAEQEGDINSPWGVIENDKTYLSSFPAALKAP